MAKLRLVKVVASEKKDKKYKAVFERTNDSESKARTRTIHFGAVGYQDYTQHHDKERRAAYRKRHAKDNIHQPDSAGSLSYWVLWGESTSFRDNLAAFRKRFGV